MKTRNKQDKEMLDRAPIDAEGSSGEQSIEEIMEQYQSQLLRYATRVLNNSEAAQDVVQDAFVRLYRNWRKVLARGVPIQGWLYRTTHNAAVDYIRKESRLRDLHDRQSDYSELCQPDDEAQKELDSRHALVLQNLGALSAKEREVLVLRLEQGMSYKEIGEVIRRSEGYVGSLIHSATKKMGQRLRRAGVVS